MKKAVRFVLKLGDDSDDSEVRAYCDTPAEKERFLRYCEMAWRWSRFLRVTELWRLRERLGSAVPFRWERWIISRSRMRQFLGLVYKGLVIGAVFTVFDAAVIVALVSDGTLKRFMKGEFHLQSLHNANIEVLNPRELFAPPPGAMPPGTSSQPRQ